jgi:hypothetical protein
MTQGKSESASGKIIPTIFLTVLLLMLIIALGGLLMLVLWVTVINPRH